MEVLPRPKAIKLFCFKCSGESYKERELCTCYDCPLWVYRNGKKSDLEELQKILKDRK